MPGQLDQLDQKEASPDHQHMHILELSGGQSATVMYLEPKYHALPDASEGMFQPERSLYDRKFPEGPKHPCHPSRQTTHGRHLWYILCFTGLMHPPKFWTSGPHIIRTLAGKSTQKRWCQLHWSQILYTRNLLGAVFKTATPSYGWRKWFSLMKEVVMCKKNLRLKSLLKVNRPLEFTEAP